MPVLPCCYLAGVLRTKAASPASSHHGVFFFGCLSKTPYFRLRRSLVVSAILRQKEVRNYVEDENIESLMKKKKPGKKTTTATAICLPTGLGNALAQAASREPGRALQLATANRLDSPGASLVLFNCYVISQCLLGVRVCV